MHGVLLVRSGLRVYADGDVGGQVRSLAKGREKFSVEKDLKSIPVARGVGV